MLSTDLSSEGIDTKLSSCSGVLLNVDLRPYSTVAEMPPVATLLAAPESQSRSDLTDITGDDELGGWMEEEDQLASDPLDVGGQHEVGLQSNTGRANNYQLVQGPSHHLAEPTSSPAVTSLPLLSGTSLDMSSALSRNHSSTLVNTATCLTLEQTSACHANLASTMQFPSDEQHSTPSQSHSLQTQTPHRRLGGDIHSQRNVSLLTMETHVFPGCSPSRDSHDSDSEIEEDELLPSSRSHPSTAIAPRPSFVRAVFTPASLSPSMSPSPVNLEDRADVCVPSSPRAITPARPDLEYIARGSISTPSGDVIPAVAPAVLIASLSSPSSRTNSGPGTKRSSADPIAETPTLKRARTGSYASHRASSEDKPVHPPPLAQQGSGALYILDAAPLSATPVRDGHSVPVSNSIHDIDNCPASTPDIHGDMETIVPETQQPRSLIISSPSSSFVSSSTRNDSPSPPRITTDHLLGRADPSYPFSSLERHDTFVLPHHNTYEHGSNTFASSSIAEDSEASRPALGEHDAGLSSNTHRLSSRCVQESKFSAPPAIIVHSDSFSGYPHNSTSPGPEPLTVSAAPSLLGPAMAVRTQSLRPMDSWASIASIEQRVYNVDVVDERDASAGGTTMLKFDLKGIKRRLRRKKRISEGVSGGRGTKLVVEEGATDIERVRSEDAARSSDGSLEPTRTIDKKDWERMTAVAHLDRRFVVARLRADGKPPDETESRSQSREVRGSGRKRRTDSLWIVEQHNATFRFEYERMTRNEKKALERQSQAEASSSGEGHIVNVAPELPDHEEKKIRARAKRVSIKQGQSLPESIMNHLVWNLGKTDEPLVCPDRRATVALLIDLNDILIRRKERQMDRKVDWGKLATMGRKLN